MAAPDRRSAVPRAVLGEADIRAARMENLLLAPVPAGSRPPAAVGRHFAAMQGQDIKAAMWALGVRSPGVDETQVRAAFDRAELIRSWPMRGTVHVMDPAQLTWFLQLSAPRVLGAAAARRREYLGLPLPTLETFRDVAVSMLAGGRQATRAQLLEAATEAGIEIRSGWGYHMVWFLCQTGVLCQGPFVPGKDEQALVLLDEWVPRARRLPDDEALRELAVTYLRAHGPAQDKDLAWWSGLSLTQVRGALALAGEAVSRVAGQDGRLFWVAVEAEQPPSPAPAAAVLLLPAFDEHLLGYTDRKMMLDAAHTPALVPGKNGVFRPTVVVDGRAAGTWQAEARRQTLGIAVTPFDAATAALLETPQIAAGLTDAAHAYRAFRHAELDVAVRIAD